MFNEALDGLKGLQVGPFVSHALRVSLFIYLPLQVWVDFLTGVSPPAA